MFQGVWLINCLFVPVPAHPGVPHTHLKRGVAKNEKLSMVIASNITYICCVYKEKIIKNESYRRTL